MPEDSNEHSQLPRWWPIHNDKAGPCNFPAQCSSASSGKQAMEDWSFQNECETIPEMLVFVEPLALSAL